MPVPHSRRYPYAAAAETTWAEFKGKKRAEAQGQQEGSGGPDGIVLPLQVVGNGPYDVAYTIEVSVGSSGQKVSLQVDTGSSDLWITSKDCTLPLCSQTDGHNYDPSSSSPTDQSFSIQYISGSVSGPIVWDKFEVGGFSIENQALAAADSVAAEPLSPLFSGILGLALPPNSIISGLIAPVTSNSPDGAIWASNLFSITPLSAAPSRRFLSLSLSRPGSTDIPSMLGIGRHPSFVENPEGAQYATLVSEREGTKFWKVGVRALTVWVDGERKEVSLGRSASGAVFPNAVLDSGVPLILTTREVANGIYGAIGISPSSEGQYFVPCTTPLNLTVTLDTRSPLPLHPLDLTTYPPSPDPARSQFCVGLIQALDVLGTPGGPADIILGVPFLRNTYTVMAYTPPEDDGTFSPSTDSGGNIQPRLGLLSLTDPATAADEFNTVRVLGQPITPGSSPGSGGSNPNSAGSNSGSGVGPKHLSVGIIVLIALLGFFALCLGLFGLRWWFARRRYPPGAASNGGSTTALPPAEKDGVGGMYPLMTRGLKSDLGDAPLSPDGERERTLRYEAYMQDHNLVDLGLVGGKLEKGDSRGSGSSSSREYAAGKVVKEIDEEDAEADVTTPLAGGIDDRDEGWGDATLVANTPKHAPAPVPMPMPMPIPVPGATHDRSGSIARPLLADLHTRSGSESDGGVGLVGGQGHDRQRSESRGLAFGDVLGDGGRYPSLPRHQHSSSVVDEFGLRPSRTRTRSRPDGDSDTVEEDGIGSMAGVGTAARGGKLGKGLGIDPLALGRR